MRINPGIGKLLKCIIMVKVFAVIVALAMEGGFLYFGERTLVAEDVVRETDSSRGAEKSDGKSGGKRRGFMDDLLNLPKVDTSQMRREEAARYLDLVERRQQQVEERISLLERREKVLVDLEKSIEEKLDRLEEERRFFAETVQHEKEIKAERLNQLVEFYRGMPPKQAAPVFERLDRDLVVHLFNQLPEKQIMNILGAMDPETSVELTEYFGRLRSGREYELLQEVNASLIEAFQDCKGM